MAGDPITGTGDASRYLMPLYPGSGGSDLSYVPPPPPTGVKVGYSTSPSELFYPNSWELWSEPEKIEPEPEPKPVFCSYCETKHEPLAIGNCVECGAPLPDEEWEEYIRDKRERQQATKVLFEWSEYEPPTGIIDRIVEMFR